MADVTDAPLGARAAQRAGALVQIAGAAMSLVLVVGVTVWGYKLFVRDVTGIPVVRAMAGPMREAPANPGGEVALHTGLSVNEVAAVGEAAPPEDVLVLAPVQEGLTPEDMEVQSMAEAGEVMPAEGTSLIPEVAPLDGAVPASLENEVDPVAATLPDTPLSADDVLALADMIAGGAAPLTPLAAGTDAPVALAVDGAAVVVAPEADAAAAVPEGTAVEAALAGVVAEVLPEEIIADVIPASVPGLAVALRPLSRPASMATASAASVAAPDATAGAATVSTALIPAGASLVQLGAYETAEIAAADWDSLSARFAEFMAGKERLIQEAESGGERFFRLRAMGFTDIEDANRFCAALVAEGARCIPVVVD